MEIGQALMATVLRSGQNLHTMNRQDVHASGRGGQRRPIKALTDTPVADSKPIYKVVQI